MSRIAHFIDSPVFGGAGLPAIVTDVGGNAEIVKSGRSGIVLANDEESTIGQAIEALLRDPKTRRAYSIEAQSTVSVRFSRKLMVESYMALYRSLLR